jgi:hypothetical protein
LEMDLLAPVASMMVTTTALLITNKTLDLPKFVRIFVVALLVARLVKKTDLVPKLFKTTETQLLALKPFKTTKAVLLVVKLVKSTDLAQKPVKKCTKIDPTNNSQLTNSLQGKYLFHFE